MSNTKKRQSRSSKSKMQRQWRARAVFAKNRGQRTAVAAGCWCGYLTAQQAQRAGAPTHHVVAARDSGASGKCERERAAIDIIATTSQRAERYQAAERRASESASASGFWGLGLEQVCFSVVESAPICWSGRRVAGESSAGIRKSTCVLCICDLHSSRALLLL
jgi:hypothetical protein